MVNTTQIRHQRFGSNYAGNQVQLPVIGTKPLYWTYAKKVFRTEKDGNTSANESDQQSNEDDEHHEYDAVSTQKSKISSANKARIRVRERIPVHMNSDKMKLCLQEDKKSIYGKKKNGKKMRKGKMKSKASAAVSSQNSDQQSQKSKVGSNKKIFNKEALKTMKASQIIKKNK